MKRKELLWMLLPCLFLLGAGLYYTRRANEPFGLVVQETVLLSATPREVSQGWDAKVRVKHRFSGLFPFDQNNLNRTMHTDFRFVDTNIGKVWKDKALNGMLSSILMTSQAPDFIPGRFKTQESSVVLFKSRYIPTSAQSLEC